MRRYTQHHAGFTLIEVIIAMSIFAIVSIMAYSGLHSVINSKSRTEASLTRLQELQITMLTLTGDMQHLTPRIAHDALGGRLLSLTTQDSDYITAFTRSGWRNPAKQARSTLQRVAYLLDDDKLIRRYWIHVDRANDDQYVDRTLIANIESLKLRFLDEKKQWKDDWPPLNSGTTTAAGNVTNTNSSQPVAIEITLNMNDWGEIKRLTLIAQQTQQ